jgi:hypothetical protein
MGIDSRRFSPCPNVAVYDDIIFNDVRAAEADLEQRLDGDVIYFTSEICMNIRSSSGRDVQQRVAIRLGGGDAVCGWLLFGSVPDARRDRLTAMERRGTLSDVEIACIRANASGLADQGFRKDGR